jgi:23S rRNA (guanine745-N1)-methyltransferase
MSAAARPPDRAILICPVRGCGAPLVRGERALRCPAGHSFDLARSGYCNLLQPQERHSAHPGDTKEAVSARRRIQEAGLGAPLIEALLMRIRSLALPPGAAVLDAGCGEGSLLAAICARLPLEGWGADISTPAIDAAARRHKTPRWIVANADRTLPFAAASFDLVLAITARKNPPEFHRLLAPNGRLLVAIEAEDDLIELRAAAQGEALHRDRVEKTRALFAGPFELERGETVRSRPLLSPAQLRDLLVGTYRAGRRGVRERLAGLESLAVTLSYELLCFRPVR